MNRSGPAAISRSSGQKDLNMANISKRIELEKLSNTRDLGGIRSADGVVRPGCLFRSGQLYFANEADIARLEALQLGRIYDFRSALERSEKPDPQIGDAENIHMPIVRDVTAGVTRDKKADSGVFFMIMEKVRDDPQFGVHYMTDTYRQMVQDGYAVSQYRKFISEVADQNDGAVLWHCTAGKDRAGFAAVLLLEILGVSREDILEDYLSTNEHIAAETDKIVAMVNRKLDISGVEQAVRDFFGAREEYIGIIYDYVDDVFGGMSGFIRGPLGITAEQEEMIRERYLM